MFFGLFNKTDCSSNNVLLDDILDVILGPFVCEEIDTWEFGVVFAVFACAVDDVGYLVHLQPFDILLIVKKVPER